MSEQPEGRVTGWRCPECGLDYDTVAPADTIVAVRSFPRRYQEALTRPARGDGDGDGDDGAGGDIEALIRRRPSPEVWSAVEYAAHVADIFDDFAPIIRRMQVEDEPELSHFNADQRAVEQGYNQQPVEGVVGHLRTAATGLASVLEGIGADEWSRLGRFDYGKRDILTCARNSVHEGSHHLRDIERGLKAVRA